MTIHERVLAGRLLGFRLAARAYERPVVLALSPAARPIALEVARVLGAPFDHYGVCTVGVAAVAEDGSVVYDARLASLIMMEPPERRELVRAWSRLRARMKRLRGDRPPLEVASRAVILVDDAAASVARIQAAARALADRRPSRVVLAVPTCARLDARALTGAVDELHALDEPLAADAHV